MSFNPIVARLLSTENLTVIQAKVKTAAFDVQKRLLILPILQPEYEGAYGMLTAHEVGHALYTNETFDVVFRKASETMKQYYNICEDVRVEKLIKRRYPGLRKVMADGYEIFNKHNYIIPLGTDLGSLIFIDRINVYFKCGFNIGVNFTDEERVLVHEVEHTESVEDVITVAEKIFALIKNQIKNAPNTIMQFKPNDESDDVFIESDEGDEDSQPAASMVVESAASGNESTEDENESTEDNSTTTDSAKDENKSEDKSEDNKTDASTNPTKDKNKPEDNKTGETGASVGASAPEMTDSELEEKMKSVTERALNEGMEHAANSNINVNTYTLETKFIANPIHSYKLILKNTLGEDIDRRLNRDDLSFDKFNTATQRIVSHMFKEFEMRKSAHRQRYAQTSKSGQLNSNKLFAYKIRDELFRNITITADDKNHGMVFMLDWSGSMNHNMKGTLIQLMSLAMFCRKAKIPFKVLAFTDNIYNDDGYSVSPDAFLTNSHVAKQADNTILSDIKLNLSFLELLSSEMNEREFTRMLKLLFTGMIQQRYALNGTPLDQALVYMHSFIAQYKKLMNIEKLTFVVLTDGEGDGLKCARTGRRWQVGVSSYSSGHVNVNKIIDPITRDTYTIDSNVTAILLKMIAKSSDCTVIGFYVCSSRDIYTVVERNCSGLDVVTKSTLIDSLKNEFRKEDYATMLDVGYDKLYLVKGDSFDNAAYIPKYDDDMTATALAKEMTKQNSVAMSNKMLMGRIIKEFS